MFIFPYTSIRHTRVSKWKCNFILSFLIQVLVHLWLIFKIIRWSKKIQIASTAFPQTDAKKKTGFNGKICIKAYLKLEKTQAVCCSHPPNILFLLNRINLSLCNFFIVNMCVHKGVFLAIFPLAMLLRCNMLTAFTI